MRRRPIRFSIVFLSLLGFLAVFLVQSGRLQLIQGKRFARLADRQHLDARSIEPVRGTIYDRRLRPLAVNVAAYSLYANPLRMSESVKLDAERRLADILSVPAGLIRKRLHRKKYFVWLARKLPGRVKDAVEALRIPGLAFVKESKRRYPDQHLAAHVIGFAGVDNVGLEGLERRYDAVLRGRPGTSLRLRDARNRGLLIEKKSIPPQDGRDLILTIDETIQYISERALQEAFEKHNAKAATIIVLDPRTGEVLALANRPTYNLSAFERSRVADRTNRAVAFVYEPGSVFKIVAAAAALEEGLFTEGDRIFCENGAYRVGPHILHDHRPHGSLSFAEVIEQSSNIGVTKIAQKLGPERFYRYARRFRFGMKTGIDLAGEVAGTLKPPSRWSKTSIGAIPIGQEVTVTPIQLAAAIAAVANGGVYMRPYVVKAVRDKDGTVVRRFDPREVGRVIRPETARRLTAILTGVVERGTGRRAAIAGVPVAGKTGTAQKIVEGTYSHSRFYASFIGFAPADDPRVAAVVVFDEPHPSHYGGTVAAPVFREVVADTLHYLASREKEGGS